MNKKLKPCPFCGGRAHIMKMGYPHWIYCEECGAKIHGGVMGEEEGEAASIVAWNRRIGESTREKEADKSASEKKEEKLFSADDVLDALVYAYAKCILQKYSMVECRTNRSCWRLFTRQRLRRTPQEHSGRSEGVFETEDR